MNVKLTKEQKIKVMNMNDIFMIMQQVLIREKKIDRNKEHLWIVCLSHGNAILMIELISLGTATSTLASPTEVFSFALQKQAAKIVMVHNHPSGELRPSSADNKITEEMMAIGKFLNLPVIDHLIISETGFYSYQDSGLYAKIESESLIDLTFSKINNLRSELEVEKIRREEEGKRKTKELALKMLEKGQSIEMVAEITGLTLAHVKRLKKAVG
jgi:DNA repair protein RadC